MRRRDLRSYAVAIALLLAVVVFSVLSPQFRTVGNILSMLREVSFIGIMAVGATFVIITGGIDLSVGSALALTGMICARLLRLTGMGALAAYGTVLVALMAGAFMGWFNGKLVSKVGLPPFITTLSTMGIFRGLTLLFAFRQFGYITNTVITNERFISLGGGKVGMIYNPILFFVAVALIGHLYLTRTKFGRYVYAVGGKEQSAVMSGINVNAVKTGVYVISGLTAALAGILWTSRLMTSTTQMGLGTELDVIAAIVVGGTSLSGGRGGVVQTVLGTLFMGVLANGMSMLGLPAYYQPLAKAVIIVAAASIDGVLLASSNARARKANPFGKSDREAGSTARKRVSRPAVDRSDVVLELEGITKRFGDIPVLKGVNLKIARGEVHALLGENGAGKSTLIKIVTGVYSKDEGTVRFNGNLVEIKNPRDALSLGISTVFQEFSLIPTLGVAENIMLGREPETKIRGVIDRRKLFQDAQRVLDELKFFLPPEVAVERLSVASNQMVEIAKALSLDSRLIIMDEPTASLSAEEKIKLFDTIRDLTARGVSVLFISHILDEVLEIADTITVLRDGVAVRTAPVEEWDKETIIRLMVGRELGGESQVPAVSPNAPEALSVEGLSSVDLLSDVSFTVHEGEILGLTGLVGAGRSEVAKAIFGLYPTSKGQIKLYGEPVTIRSPKDAMAHGIAFLSEDRKREGLVLIHSVAHNITMANLGAVSNSWSVIDRGRELSLAKEYVSKMDIRPARVDLPVSALSGGNQQKVVLAKWLSRKPRILIVDEPTVGIDIGAKHEIYKTLCDLAAQGAAILLISSDFEEILRLSTNIKVMRNGRIVASYTRGEATQEKLMRAAIGQEEQ